MRCHAKPHARTFDRSPTPRQRQALAAIRDFTVRMGMPPTVRELQSMLGLASSHGASEHLRLLLAKGLIERLPMRSRGIRLTAAGRNALRGMWRAA